MACWYITLGNEKFKFSMKHAKLLLQKFLHYVTYFVFFNVIWVLLKISYAFQQCKKLENRLRFDKVTDN